MPPKKQHGILDNSSDDDGLYYIYLGSGIFTRKTHVDNDD